MGVIRRAWMAEREVGRMTGTARYGGCGYRWSRTVDHPLWYIRRLRPLMLPLPPIRVTLRPHQLQAPVVCHQHSRARHPRNPSHWRSAARMRSPSLLPLVLVLRPHLLLRPQHVSLHLLQRRTSKRPTITHSSTLCRPPLRNTTAVDLAPATVVPLLPLPPRPHQPSVRHCLLPAYNSLCHL